MDNGLLGQNTNILVIKSFDETQLVIYVSDREGLTSFRPRQTLNANTAILLFDESIDGQIDIKC